MAWKSNEIITIEADFARENNKNIQLDCEGDLVWFPKKSITFNKEAKELKLPVWLYKAKFEDEPV